LGKDKFNLFFKAFSSLLGGWKGLKGLPFQGITSSLGTAFGPEGPGVPILSNILALALLLPLLFSPFLIFDNL